MATITLYSVSWCPFCRRLKPIWDRVKSKAVEFGVRVVEVDGDRVRTRGVDAYPTIIAVTNGGDRHEFTGSMDYTTLIQWVKSVSL